MLQRLPQMGRLVWGDFHGIGGLVFRQHLTVIGKHQTAGRGDGDESRMIIISQGTELGKMQHLQVHDAQYDEQNRQQHQASRYTEPEAKVAITFGRVRKRHNRERPGSVCKWLGRFVHSEAKSLVRWGGAVLESRFESLFAELESIITDYRGLRRHLEGDGRDKRSLQVLQKQIQMLDAENVLLRERQEAVCLRLSELLTQVSHWENEG